MRDWKANSERPAPGAAGGGGGPNAHGKPAAVALFETCDTP